MNSILVKELKCYYVVCQYGRIHRALSFEDLLCFVNIGKYGNEYWLYTYMVFSILLIT